MAGYKPTVQPSLYWRTFVLILLLIVFCVMGWLQSFRVLNEAPYAQSTAQQIVSMANLTRYALITADPHYRPDLLMVLASREGLRILPRESDDKVEPLESEYSVNSVSDVEYLVRRDLGPDTVLASRVNGEKGLWVSVSIDGDEYWLMTSSTLFNPRYGTTWLWWALAAFVASVLGVLFITQRLTTPLKALSSAAREFGRGKIPQNLPEDSGPAELRELNSSFNRMVSDINRMEKDREMLLAGVSHDLRTPITRLRLETEMADLPEETHTNMVHDLELMEGIVNQFMDYARRSNKPQTVVSFSDIVHEAINTARIDIDPSIRLVSQIEPDLFVLAEPIELGRVVQNLFTNAMRYGRSNDEILYLDVRLRKERGNAVLAVSDKGVGLDMTQAERVMRPFERGDSARGGATGTGLGLAIVDRIVRRSDGVVTLGSVEPHGLRVQIAMPVVSPDTRVKDGKVS